MGQGTPISQFYKVIKGVTASAVVLASVFIIGAVSPVAAQSKPAAAPAKKAAATPAAEKAYAAGVKAFDKGKAKDAVASLSTALSQGGLPPQKMAKALFYRGSAYRKQGKPAQAISDLTSAVWIKGGLSDADRLSAIEQRKAAYKEAGLGTKVPTGLQPGAGVPSTAPAKPVPITAKAPTGTATSAWTTTAATAKQQPTATPSARPTAPAPRTQPAAVPTTPATGLAPSVTATAPPSTTLSAMPRGDSTSKQTAQTETGVGTTLSNIGSSISQGVSNVGSFFSNAFSSNTASTPSAGSSGTQIATSSTARPPQPWSPPSTAKSAPAVTQGWSSATQPSAAPAKAAPQPRVRTAAVKPAPKPQPSPRAGNIRLQVAAVRSEAKAQNVVAQLRSKYAAQLAGATPKIDAASIGNMGTFYRVRVGPYANANQPRALCSKLRTDGYDCLIVTP